MHIYFIKISNRRPLKLDRNKTDVLKNAEQIILPGSRSISTKRIQLNISARVMRIIKNRQIRRIFCLFRW